MEIGRFMTRKMQTSSNSNRRKVALWHPGHIDFGLGDRMRGLASGLVLARALDCDLLAQWESTRACPAEWDELFAPLQGHFPYRTIPARRLNLLEPDFIWTMGGNIHPNYGYRDTYRAAPSGHPDFVDVTAFKNAWARELRAFQPIPAIMEAVQQTTSSFPEFTLGIHLRRTDVMNDPKKPINQDNVHLYDQSLWDEAIRTLEDHPNAAVFIAADREDYQRDWSERFQQLGIRVCIHQKTWFRAGMRKTPVSDALIDMMLFSRTSVLLSSVRSSLAFVASTIGRNTWRVIAPEKVELQNPSAS